MLLPRSINNSHLHVNLPYEILNPLPTVWNAPVRIWCIFLPDIPTDKANFCLRVMVWTVKPSPFLPKSTQGIYKSPQGGGEGQKMRKWKSIQI